MTYIFISVISHCEYSHFRHNKGDTQKDMTIDKAYINIIQVSRMVYTAV